MTRKGMSQTLALIVAASVFMMTALTVIFMVQGGLSDTDQGVSTSGCVQAIQFRCDRASEIAAPANCFSGGEPIPNSPVAGLDVGPGDDISCDNF